MSTNRGGLLFGVAIAVVAAAIAAGIRLIGPPSEARQHRLDERRVHALNETSYAVDRYYALHRRLPPDLTVLAEVSDAAGRDPVTNEAFEYRVGDSAHYELCAVFARRTPRREATDFWWHDAGRQCYGLQPRKEPR